MEDNTYNYRGYTIIDDVSGIFVNGMEFVSIEEAEEWIDAQLEDDNMVSVADSEKTFIIFFVAPNANKHSTVDVPAANLNDAIDWVENIYCPGAQVIDWDTLDD
jgi:hypothetical protein